MEAMETKSMITAVKRPDGNYDVTSKPFHDLPDGMRQYTGVTDTFVARKEADGKLTIIGDITSTWECS